jgi:hypothetical protein
MVDFLNLIPPNKKNEQYVLGFWTIKNLDKNETKL